MALMAEKEKTEMSKREVRLYGNAAVLYVFFFNFQEFPRNILINTSACFEEDI